jgi:hypothetical protein
MGLSSRKMKAARLHLCFPHSFGADHKLVSKELYRR